MQPFAALGCVSYIGLLCTMHILAISVPSTVTKGVDVHTVSDVHSDNYTLQSPSADWFFVQVVASWPLDAANDNSESLSLLQNMSLGALLCADDADQNATLYISEQNTSASQPLFCKKSFWVLLQTHTATLADGFTEFPAVASIGYGMSGFGMAVSHGALAFTLLSVPLLLLVLLGFAAFQLVLARVYIHQFVWEIAVTAMFLCMFSFHHLAHKIVRPWFAHRERVYSCTLLVIMCVYLAWLVVSSGRQQVSHEYIHFEQFCMHLLSPLQAVVCYLLVALSPARLSACVTTAVAAASDVPLQAPVADCCQEDGDDDDDNGNGNHTTVSGGKNSQKKLLQQKNEAELNAELEP